VTDAERDAWGHVWADNLASVASNDPAYAILQSWWLREFRSLGRLGRVLEIGAGGAAQVASLVASAFPGTEVIASDFRTLPEGRIRGVTWRSDAPIEALPFPDAHIDVLASQFAFEYARRAEAVVALARVVRPGGAARLIMHHPGSAFSSRLPHRVKCLTAGIALFRAASAPDHSRSIALKQALRRLDELLAAYAKPPVLQDVLDDLRDFAATGKNVATVTSNSADDMAYLQQCDSALHLTRQQLKAAYTNAQMNELMQQFRAAGFTATQYGPLDDHGRLLAWAVRLQK
jgi:ubiquinone/menaquinone biosynthesis C-methylase UbiE